MFTPKLSTIVKLPDNILAPEASPSFQPPTSKLLNAAPPELLFNIALFKSDNKPLVDVSQYISNALSTGSVSYTDKNCIPGILSSP